MFPNLENGNRFPFWELVFSHFGNCDLNWMFGLCDCISEIRKVVIVIGNGCVMSRSVQGYMESQGRYILTARSGQIRGKAWLIPDDQPLTIGRDHECSIVIEDPLISRHHCEIYYAGGELRVRDLGSSNSTFVNGHPIKEKTLRVGDDIGVGSIVFSVGVVVPPAKTGRDESKRARATRPIKIGLPVFIEGTPQSLFESGNPRTAEELAELFSLARSLSQLFNVEDIIQHVLGVIQTRFNPNYTALVMFGNSKDDNTVYPATLSETVLTRREITDIFAQIRMSPRGVLLPERVQQKDQVAISNTIIAPIVLGKDVIGVLLAVSITPNRLYDESDLELLLAIAHTIAPYLRAAERIQQLEWENQRLILGGFKFDPLIGESKAIQRVRALARDCARTDMSVMILGETGTGKELVARLIHNLSHRSSKPMIIVNCAAIPEELFESELFGHEKGAFTGAHATKIGLMEEADGGTLFLDEVGDLSLPHQARLLRAIETGTFRRVGGNTDIRVNVRVISATNKDIPVEVNAGRFRRDLFHRLNTFIITIPPLRERRTDIPQLAEYFLKRLRERMPIRPSRISTQALKWLETQPWEGNVRELRNVVERAAVICQSDEIQTHHLVSDMPAVLKDQFPTLMELERQHIVEALRRTQGNVVSAAQLLGIGKSTLYRKIEEYKINPAQFQRVQEG